MSKIDGALVDSIIQLRTYLLGLRVICKTGTTGAPGCAVLLRLRGSRSLFIHRWAEHPRYRGPNVRLIAAVLVKPEA